MRTIPDESQRHSDADAGREVRRGVTALAARARAERPGTLPISHVAVLAQLSRRGAMTAGEVASRLRSSPQALTRVFAALQDAGHLERTADPGDRRQALLSATPAGQAALIEDMAPRDRWLSKVIAAELTEAERDLLVVASRLMLRLADVDASPAVVEP